MGVEARTAAPARVELELIAIMLATVTVAVITAVVRMMKIWRIFLSSQRRWCSQASGSREGAVFVSRADTRPLDLI